MMSASDALLRFRLSLGVFIAGLVLSGITAFPLLGELRLLAALLGVDDAAAPETASGLASWIRTVRDGLERTYADFPWIGYGTDWLAFGHLVIAMFFVGPWRDPVSNRWVLVVGIVACIAVMPLALICGGVRSIPFAWRLIDCSFGLFGLLPLIYCLRLLPAVGSPTPRPLPGNRARACQASDRR